MKRTLIAVALLAASAGFSTAQAQGYAGASIGQSDFKVDCDPGLTCDLKDTGYKVFGGFMFAPNFGVEGAYLDLGKATASGSVTIVNGGTVTITETGSLKASGFGLWGVGVAPIGNASVFAKLGFASIKAKAEFCDPICGSESKTATDLAWGVGAGYNFTPNLGARVEWERFRAKFPDGEKFDIDFLSAGVVYRF